MQTTTVHNFTMTYDEQGQGQPILFIHGYPLSRMLWEPQLTGLADIARVLVPDLPGHGESQAIPGPYWMEDLADDVKVFLDNLGVSEPVVICGLSMGGYVAMAFYRMHAARMRALILAATRPGADSEEARANRDKAAEQARREGVITVVEAMLPKILAPETYQQQPELVDYVRRMMLSTSTEGAVGDLMGMKERPDSTDTLKEILLPTLILHGEDDQIIPPKEAEGMHRLIVNSRLELIPGAGHLLNLEQPDKFNNAVRSFLEQV